MVDFTPNWDRYEQIIRENERMKTALSNIMSYASRSIFGGWRQQVWDMASAGLPETRRAARPAKIAPTPPEALRDASPRLGDVPGDGGPDVQRVRELGGFPSKLCEGILGVLIGQNAQLHGLTADEIGDSLGVPHGAGQILGATSNMVNKMDRQWLRFDGRDPDIRRWYITDRGKQILALSRKYS